MSYAIISQWTIESPEKYDAAGGDETLRSQIVPRVAATPGFLLGRWTRDDDKTLASGLLEVETKEQAEQMVELMQANSSSNEAGVNFKDAWVMVVTASA